MEERRTEKPAWSYQFPDATIIARREFGSDDVGLQAIRILGEVQEVLEAIAKEPEWRAEWRVASELMDVIQASETALRMMDVDVCELSRIKLATIAKNEARGYYGGL